MKRVYLARFNGPVKGFAVNYLKRNYWRVQGFIEYDDLMQEAEFINLKIVRKYHIENAAHHMALFKSSFVNYVNGLSNKRTQRGAHEVDLSDEIAEEYAQDGPVSYNDGYLFCLIEQAPAEVRAVLSLLSAAPRELIEEITKSWRLNGRRKAISSKHLGELLGYSSDTDLIREVEEFFNS